MLKNDLTPSSGRMRPTWTAEVFDAAFDFLQKETTPTAATGPTDDDERACIVCFEFEMGRWKFACGHRHTCGTCAHQLQEKGKCCPTCRGPIGECLAYDAEWRFTGEKKEMGEQ